MAGLRGDARGLETAGTAARDDDAACAPQLAQAAPTSASRPARALTRRRRCPSRRRQSCTMPTHGPDLADAALARLGHPLRVGEHAAADGDEVDAAVGKRPLGERREAGFGRRR